MTNIPRLSATSTARYGKCSRQWAFIYVEGRRMKPAGVMKQGDACHVAYETNNKQKIESHADLAMTEMTDIFATTFEEKMAAEEVELNEGETKGKLKDQGVAIVKAHHQVISPQVQPVQVEQWYETVLPLDEETTFTLVGKLDVVDAQGRIRDNKAIAPNRVPTPTILANDPQLSVYSILYRLANQKREAGLTLDAVVKYPKPKAMVLEAKRTKDVLKDQLQDIAAVARGIRADSFPRTDPTNWWCSAKWCGFWSICRGRNLVTVDMKVEEQQLKESVNG